MKKKKRIKRNNPSGRERSFVRHNRRKRKNSFSSTPFDDAFKTLITGPSEIVIPFLNEMFPDGKPIPDDAILEQERNEFLINLPEVSDSSGEISAEHLSRKRQKKVITDSNLRCEGRRFHLECQSSPDGTMLIRMFEYDAQIALSHREIHNGVLDVFFPESGVLYVRESGWTPEKLKVRIHTSGTDAEYEVRKLKVKDYTEDDLFRKRLYLLVPFHLCIYEKQISKAETDAVLRERLTTALGVLLDRLNREHDAGKLTDYSYATIMRVFRSLGEYMTRKYETVGEEVRTIMGGKVIDYPERRLYNAGRADEKRVQKKNQDERTIQVYKNCLVRGMSKADAIAISEISKDLLKSIGEA